ncbi:uncharacterized protein [Euphorbia lathyris]|uniref:uncharacterized protein isoform X3 n=1 Tax=Euphorbia lathyris TaxID=212925 RepID=UPI003313738A
MLGDEAKMLLGFPPNSHPTSDEVKAAYKKKVWQSHPDLFPSHEKHCAESRFKLISEAYTYLLSGARGRGEDSASGLTESRKKHILRTIHFCLDATLNAYGSPWLIGVYLIQQYESVFKKSCCQFAEQ